MSRLLVFDLQNQRAGDIRGIFDRGWMISEGESSVVRLDSDQALKPFLQLGRMVYVEHPKLPGYAGMIDTPWKAKPPVELCIYDIPYLLEQRQPYYPDTIDGTVGRIARKLIDLGQQPGNLFIKMGDVASSEVFKDYPIEQRSIWKQLQEIVAKADMELAFRSEISEAGQLVNYLDIQPAFGVITPLVLQDGEDGNAEIVEAVLDGDIRNAILGVSDEAEKGDRKYSAIKINRESQQTYRTRNAVVQFAAGSQSDLEACASAELKRVGTPYITLTVNVSERKPTSNDFYRCRIGNTVTMRATELILPEGRKGWTGAARIRAMRYLEARNQMQIKIQGAL